MLGPFLSIAQPPSSSKLLLIQAQTILNLWSGKFSDAALAALSPSEGFDDALDHNLNLRLKGFAPGIDKIELGILLKGADPVGLQNTNQSPALYLGYQQLARQGNDPPPSMATCSKEGALLVLNQAEERSSRSWRSDSIWVKRQQSIPWRNLCSSNLC